MASEIIENERRELVKDAAREAMALLSRTGGGRDSALAKSGAPVFGLAGGYYDGAGAYQQAFCFGMQFGAAPFGKGR